MEVKINFQPNLAAEILQGDVQQVILSPYFKISLKRYVERIEGAAIIFKSTLSYIAIKKIIEIFEKNSLSHGFVLLVNPEVVDYINKREMYLDTRSKLGVEIKNKDSKLQIEYNEFKLIVDANLERSLRDKQMWDAFFMTSMKKSGNFSVPGSGKTSSVYGMFAFLKHKDIVNKLVVICPKNAFGPWIDEFSACFGSKESLTLYNIQSVEAKTKLQKKNSIKFDTSNSNLILFNYECTKNYVNEISSIIDEKTLLVYDEVHKVKRVDGEYATAAITIARKANYIVAMTGTPIPNTYQDIYNLLHILYNEEYDDFFAFQAKGLARPSQTTIEAVNRKLQPFFCRTTKNELGVPKPNSDSIIPVPASPEETSVFNAFIKKYKKNKLLLMLRLLQLESQSEQLLSAIDLSDFQYILNDDVPVNEIDYADYSDDVKSAIESIGVSSKTIQCVNLVRGLITQNKPVVVWCIFVKTIQNLASELEKIGIKVKCVYGEVELSERQSILKEFKSGVFDVLITNPNTLAESVSLHTICHDAIYFEYSFNLVHLLQSKDRIHRLGLPEDQYTQFYFLQVVYPNKDAYYSMGEQIYNRLQTKENIMLDAIESNLLEVLPTTQEELDLIFKPLTII